MAKQQKCHKYIYKLHSTTLKNARWKLELPLEKAMANKTDLIALTESQMLRWIDELRDRDTDATAKAIKKQIRIIKKMDSTEKNKNLINTLYKSLYKTQFCPDYLTVIMDKNSDYDRANKKFSINGLKKTRLLGTNGGIKNSTIVYVADDLHDILQERIDCGRDKTVPLIPAKLEAYQALVCSGSIPVSTPNGIIVVPDCITHFKEDAILIDDSESDEPIVTHAKDHEIELDESDGYGLMLPSLSQRWNEELGGEPGEYLSGANLRGLPWVKGMAFTVDFIEFADKIAQNYMIKDVWGDWRDVRDAELILTESQLKLWNCYSSWEDYWSNVEKYHYQIAVAKTAPHELDDERLSNYQFLQSYHLTDEEVYELCEPTINEIKDILGGDWRKTLLFLCGTHIKPSQLQKEKNYSYTHAIMADPECANDPFIVDKVYRMIKKRIQQAMIGAITLQGNYAIIGGDPYSLMQSMFGLPVTGILQAGECYHKYWSDRYVEEVCCFRAPMTSKYNIRKLKPIENKETRRWFQYIDTCVLLNSWDSTAEALNGCDKDGDILFTTNNPVLLRHTENLPAIFCVQRKGEKKIVTTEDIIKANKGSFGDMIGHTTNIITAQICLQAHFPKDSEEYKVLEYRILCGQLFQQNCIDAAKGIIAKPMPRYWYEYRLNVIKDGDSEEEIKKKLLNQRICAEKKPYFFRYNYSSLDQDCKSYEKQHEQTALINFDQHLNDLLIKENKTEKESEFIGWYYRKYPLDNSNCLINRICWLFEREFKDIKKPTTDFDIELYKTDTPYTSKEYMAILQLYKDYGIARRNLIRLFGQESLNITLNKSFEYIETLKELFEMECYSVISNEETLSNILVDICYSNKNSKHMAWDICGTQIVENMLSRNGHKFHYPARNEDGEFTFMQNAYSVEELTLEDDYSTDELYFE